MITKSWRQHTQQQVSALLQCRLFGSPVTVRMLFARVAMLSEKAFDGGYVASPFILRSVFINCYTGVSPCLVVVVGTYRA
jgi:hypothetical protein